MKKKCVVGFVIVLVIAFLGFRPAAYAVTLDLTAVSSGTINGASFSNFNIKSGTGIFDPFLSLHTYNNPDGPGQTTFEQEYNTSTRPLPYPGGETTADRNHDLGLTGTTTPIFGALSDNVTTVGGIQYYDFLLDAGQNGSSNLSLDTLIIYQSTHQGINTTPFTATSFPYRIAYDMGSTNNVIVNANIGNGNGSSDMEFLVPVIDFDPAYQYVYFYAYMGGQNGYNANGSFEEWGQRIGGGGGNNTVIPEPATLSLFGLGLLGLLGLRKKKSSV